MLDDGAIFTRIRAADATAMFSGVGDGSLRQRGVAGTQQFDSEDSPIQSDSDVPTRGDSLSLFAGLVPPPLRKSKKNFTSGESFNFYAQALHSLVYVMHLAGRDCVLSIFTPQVAGYPHARELAEQARICSLDDRDESTV